MTDTRKKLTTPLSAAAVADLYAGDQVLISGIMFTGRDAAHKRLTAELSAKGVLPLDLKGRILYYTGPAPARPGQLIGPAGPTTSCRMDPYSPVLLKKAGLKGMIGKGERSKEVKSCLKECKAVYFSAVGGAAALLARSVKAARVILYEDLGPEAVYRLEVEDFPAVVTNDSYGNDLFRANRSRYACSD
ncbi:MAG TPA: Fe-S-containing hydro-lyase [Spirochaetota bacterium]|nr:Fe-S-containing hydro-lyase [Spirochaetota bacterium]